MLAGQPGGNVKPRPRESTSVPHSTVHPRKAPSPAGRSPGPLCLPLSLLCQNFFLGLLASPSLPSVQLICLCLVSLSGLFLLPLPFLPSSPSSPSLSSFPSLFLLPTSLLPCLPVSLPPGLQQQLAASGATHPVWSLCQGRQGCALHQEERGSPENHRWGLRVPL